MAERDLFLAALIKKGLDGLNKKVDTLAAVAGEEASWASIKKVVAAGMAPNAYPIGTQFSVSHTKYGNLLSTSSPIITIKTRTTPPRRQ